MRHLQHLWGQMSDRDRGQSFRRLQNLATHVMPVEVASSAPGTMLIPLPGTAAFSDWMQSLLEEARHQRVR